MGRHFSHVVDSQCGNGDLAASRHHYGGRRLLMSKAQYHTTFRCSGNTEKYRVDVEMSTKELRCISHIRSSHQVNYLRPRRRL